MYKIKCESDTLAYKNSASIELELCRTKDAIALQLAQCCCELKGKIGEESKTTQQLVQALDNNRVRDSLASVNTENVILRMQSQQCYGNGNGNGGGPRNA